MHGDAVRSALDAAATLEAFPGRCRLAPENGPFEFEIRQLLYGNYRLLFTVRDDTVVILHVRHRAAMDEAGGCRPARGAGSGDRVVGLQRREPLDPCR